MKKNYRFTLFITLISFTLIIATFFSATNYFKLKEQLIYSNELEVEYAADKVMHALKSLDKAYYVLDHDAANKMKHNMLSLQNKYINNPDIDSWNIKQIANELGMDVYIINNNNIISHTNVYADLGMNFPVCCASLTKQLDERRVSGELFIDGLDVEQKTGTIKKYSYQASPDKHYIFELGSNLENELILEKYNFLTEIDELVQDILPIEEINVINRGGVIYGANGGKVYDERKIAFEKARNSDEMVEIKQERDSESVMIRYIPITLEYDTTTTKSNVVEVIYNQKELTELLKHNRQLLFIQYFFILIITTILSMILSSWLSRPMYLAFHDSLTGLKNRASFDEDLEKILVEEKRTVMLLLLDLDNFKMINDKLGHHSGDEMLKLTATTIHRIVGETCTCYRLGGDEFVIILPEGNRSAVLRIAHELFEEFEIEVQAKEELSELPVSISLGYAMSIKDDTPTDLLKKADIALYKSKENELEKIQEYIIR